MKIDQISTLIIGYEEFFKVSPPPNKIDILIGFSKQDIIVELAKLNYRLKPKANNFIDISQESQNRELNYFCNGDADLLALRIDFSENFKKEYQKNPIFFTRQSCVAAMEEIIQSEIPIIKGQEVHSNQLKNAVFYYILAVNSEIFPDIPFGNCVAKNNEKLSFLTIQFNEYNLISDPLFIPYRSFHLLQYLSANELGNHLDIYFNQKYLLSWKDFIRRIMKLYELKEDNEIVVDFSLRPEKNCENHQNQLSDDWKKIVNVRKWPFYRLDSGEYIILDTNFLLDLLFAQFINDFWFDYLKKQKDESINIKKFKSSIGRFFEDYVSKLFKLMLDKNPIIKCYLFDELKIKQGSDFIEFADVYIRYNNKLIIGQVKSTSLYDDQKFAVDLDNFYRDKDYFFNNFGLKQIVLSIEKIPDSIFKFDSDFKFVKNFVIYPVIIITERAMQTPLVANEFQLKFEELISKNKKIRPEVSKRIKPITLLHISDLEILKDYLDDKKCVYLFNLLKYHTNQSKFVTPFYHTLNTKNIRPNYKSIVPFLSENLLTY